MAEKLSIKERQTIERELKTLLEGETDLDIRRGIVTDFCAEKRKEGLIVPVEELAPLIEGPKPLGRPRGRNVKMDDLCPMMTVKLVRTGTELTVPTTKESLLVRNFFTTEAVRGLLDAYVWKFYEDMAASKGTRAPDLETVEKIIRLTATVNDAAKKEYEAIWKQLKDSHKDGDEVDIDGLKEGLEAVVDMMVGKKKKPTASDEDVLSLAKSITRKVKEEDASLLGESE